MLDDLTTPRGDAHADILATALDGLDRPRKTLPAKLFYDEEGCRLFGAITQLPEYYVTRVEMALLRDIAPEIGRAVPAGAAVVEYGASSPDKAALLLGALRAPAAYVPIDVAEAAALATAEAIERRFPGLPASPLSGDFLGRIPMPAAIKGIQLLGFFPGSTIGNLEPAAAVAFLRNVRADLGGGSLFLVGVDLRKDPKILVPAYDDAAGVTAAFNLNLLARLNREAGADFDLSEFRHRALWNDREGRIEMHLVSQRAQQVRIGGRIIRFEAGETIHTENSYKHTVEGFRRLAERARWIPSKLWTDPGDFFSVHLLIAGE